MIHGLTLQKVGKRFDLRCPECTSITGRIGLVMEDGPPLKLFCRVHPENYGQWRTAADMEKEKLELAARIGLK